ncbi:pantetheine-phosphate adenylyltransferase [Clostridium felsineum]|uniref:Phosphopantetheine adenylyltransferase n=1 Tax=Clostridium felsineum TaxID=36839 RepID=A0A1S8LMW2_9CLOT|nr:pantetheine-phosphate adenylyltransferase [Clostridium felsineum]MCR3759319.1 pantetheine-phosphate adenylyltransferase [Clostridium felsineum]URZ00798.1 Phosphopantetheine adenylyltransferase [Clostridium felsineum]URZ06563.1 Phosphopantetheine adenylyltransferase [Clostridium felsineum]URZ11598.1 Phosphopantetheine adenylyltransferase [Clostridium felsineum]URZ16161.1 Phosphopantetheine adenylyltransferase [Clostridium felsineum DSM 794]
MKVAVYPGSFDPITNGHLDIISRASKVFDKVIVGVLINPDKKGMFTVDERVELISRVTKPFENVSVQSFSGLLVNFMKNNDSNVMVRGLRSVGDFEYELQTSLMNKKLDPNVETVFMMTSLEFSFLSSSAIKQVAVFGGCIKGLVPDEIIEDVLKKAR